MLSSCCRVSGSLGSFRPKESFCSPIQRVALRVFKELAASLLLSSITFYFTPTLLGQHLLGQALLIQAVLSVIFHSFQEFALCHPQKCGSFVKIFEWASTLSFGLLSGYNIQTLVHESGHALASTLVYKNPRPSIEIHPFSGGHTHFYKTALSLFGHKLGPKLSTLFVIASGPGLTLLVSSATFVLGMFLFNQGKLLGKYLLGFSLVDFANHARYAYSALHTPPYQLSHDFVHLSVFGLNPVVATVGIIAIPVILYLSMRKTKSHT